MNPVLESVLEFVVKQLKDMGATGFILLAVFALLTFLGGCVIAVCEILL